MGFPEVGRQFHATRIQHIRVVNRLVIKVIFRFKSHGRGLDAHVDIFGDQDNGAFFFLAL